MHMDNPLTGIFDKVTSFFKSGGSVGSVVGIDIGTSAIKVAQLRIDGGKAVLETYGSIALGSYAGLDAGATTNLMPDDLKIPLEAILKESGVTTTRAVFSVPAPASMIFVLDLPKGITEKQFPTVVPTEARRFIPVPISEVSLNYWPLPKKEQSFEDPTVDHPVTNSDTEVLVAAIHQDTVGRYNEISAKNGFSSQVEIETFSTVRSVFNRELFGVMVVDFGALKTKVALLEYGVIRGVHVINRGGADITHALATSLNLSFEKAETMKKTYGIVTHPDVPQAREIILSSVQYILGEIKTALSDYERTHGTTIVKIIVTGGGALLPGLMDEMPQFLGREIIRGNPFRKVSVPQFLEHVLETTGPEFAVAVGLALRGME